jgi:addiction module RelE/StbE family toxin
MQSKKRLEWSKRAEKRLDTIYDYIALENTVAAQKVTIHLLDSALSLVDFPEVGHAGKREGTRELVLTKYPYTLIYKLSATRIVIVAVVHKRQKN